MSGTPRTEKGSFVIRHDDGTYEEVINADACRSLERELAEAKATFEQTVERLTKENTELRKDKERLEKQRDELYDITNHYGQALENVKHHSHYCNCQECAAFEVANQALAETHGSASLDAAIENYNSYPTESEVEQ